VWNVGFQNRMADTWIISANGQPYGPYDVQQMRAFAAEGRLAAHSRVARDGDENFHPASEDQDLAPLFRAKPASRPTFFTAEGDIGAQSGSQSFGKVEEDGQPERNHYIIVADMKSRSISGLEEAIFKFGQVYPLTPQSWVLSSDQPINAIRNALVQKMGKIDYLFIVDATHNKAAWFNYGPEAESRIRRIWQRMPETARIGG
jgi:hypothetical protein